VPPTDLFHPMSKLLDLQQLHTTTLVAGTLSVLAVTWLVRQARGAKRIPGPPGLPLLGNLLSFPKAKEWLAYARWAEEYGVSRPSWPAAVCLMAIALQVISSASRSRPLVYRSWSSPPKKMSEVSL